MRMDALNFRLGDIPRSAALIARAKGGLGRLGDVDFGQAWDDYGAVVDYGGVDYASADYFMPYDEIDYTAEGFSDWQPFYDFGAEVAPAEVPWPSDPPVWSWGSPSFDPALDPAVSGESGTVTSEGVGSSWWDGSGLSLPSLDSITRLLQTGGQIYTTLQQQEINQELAQQGIIPRTMVPTTTLPGVPRTTTGTAPMVWNPATNRYEPASAASGQLIPGVDNTILFAGAAGVAALLLLGGKKRRG